MLISVVQYDQRQQEWNETKVAYPARKNREVGNSALIIAIILVILSAFISSISLQRIIHWTSESRRSQSQSESGLAKSLGIVPAATATPDALSPIRNPGLPRELLIGSGPELSGEQVMSVEVKDLPALLQSGHLSPLYWRSFTYDIYTGRGWSSSPTQQSQYLAEQPVQTDQLPDHKLIQEVVRSVPGEGGIIYSAGEPVSMSVPSLAAWRSSNDLFGIQTESSGYEIQTLLPVADENSMREAGQVYPNWVAQRYLALSAEVPTRVRALAIQLTATEPTPYDRARAIEQYLRTYPYTLDVPRPPTNQDLSDYFLFDLRKGYCDYYASAMVVLARAAGIPARLAIGYASGTYNEKSERFIVTQADAHSWVEVYFPGIGWVPFEPTAGLSPINRSPQPTQEATPPPPAPATQPSGAGIGNIGKYIGIMLLGLAVATGFLWAILDEMRLRRLKPLPAAREVYRRMRRYGELLRVPMDGGETPYEFAALLSTRIPYISRQKFSASSSLTTVSESLSIIRKIVRLSYRPSDGETESASVPASTAGIIDQWKSLRWRLRLMWILRIWESIRLAFQEGFMQRNDKRQTMVE